MYGALGDAFDEIVHIQTAMTTHISGIARTLLAHTVSVATTLYGHFAFTTSNFDISESRRGGTGGHPIENVLIRRRAVRTDTPSVAATNSRFATAIVETVSIHTARMPANFWKHPIFVTDLVSAQDILKPVLAVRAGPARQAAARLVLTPTVFIAVKVISLSRGIYTVRAAHGYFQRWRAGASSVQVFLNC